MNETRRRARVALRRQHRPVSIIGVLGEIFLTAGVVCFLFLGWQLWLNDLVVGNEQRSNALDLVEEWNSAPTASATPAAPVAPDGDANVEPVDHGEPIVRTAPATAKAFATLYVPRFGAEYVRVIGEGVSLSKVLNNAELGVGHYPDTQMPGAIGNFAVAAHRTTWGAPFRDIGSLRPGDKIYVQTEDGWYTYGYRSLEYVRPTGVDVLQPVPQAPGAAAADRIITLTSCNPLFSAAERIIAYGVLESWQPTSAGAPAELAGTLNAGG
ncbi:MAG: class sortase [Homoserinimonas sp.]|jgi:sortase A|nr:class sortase [Homoserinimonas sp.]